MVGRRFGRVIALAGLYQIEMARLPLENVLKFDWVDDEINDETKEFATDLIKGSVDHIDQIDKLINKYSKNWSFDRISTIDKSILRFSIYSLLYRTDIPHKVVIDEAIEISKKYSTEKAYQFINGVLDGIKNNEIEKKPKKNH
ncbi:MAG: transcription antitermination factor NusB [Spirochaetes bacterium]|nr:transcription antitermination factor NusB [Spirochaetota bacterium]